MKTLLQFLVTWIAIAIAAYVVPGVTVDGLRTAIVVWVVLAIVNATVGALLRLITLPLNLITLWLVGVIIGVLMILLVDNFVDGFSVSNFRSGLLFAIILGAINMIFGNGKD